jgi:hypothetical protein
MNIFKYLLLLCAFISCAKKPDPLPEPKDNARIAILRGKYEAKLNQAKEAFDKTTGWPEINDCDALLWAGLARAGGLESVKLDYGEYDSAGELQRRPYEPCWKNGVDQGAKSTVSRDMVIGYLWGRWVEKNTDAVQRFADRSASKNWVIGEPYPERIGEVLLTNNLIGLLGRMTCEMNKKCPEWRKLGPVNSKSGDDYVQHLTVLYVLLDAKVWNGLGVKRGLSDNLDILQWHAERKPKDALFQATYHAFKDGDFNSSLDLILSDAYEYPTYIRGSGNYQFVHWLFVARFILDSYIAN